MKRESPFERWRILCDACGCECRAPGDSRDGDRPALFACDCNSPKDERRLALFCETCRLLHVCPRRRRAPE